MAEIWAYLAAEASDAVANRFLDALENKCVALCATPHVGAPRDVFRPGLRVIFHGAYAIYYIATKSELVLVRMLHGAQDVAALAKGIQRGATKEITGWTYVRRLRRATGREGPYN